MIITAPVAPPHHPRFAIDAQPRRSAAFGQIFLAGEWQRPRSERHGEAPPIVPIRAARIAIVRSDITANRRNSPIRSRCAVAAISTFNAFASAG